MIDEQNYGKEIKLVEEKDHVQMLVLKQHMGLRFRPEAAIAFGHSLIQAGEHVAKDSGVWKEP